MVFMFLSCVCCSNASKNATLHCLRENQSHSTVKELHCHVEPTEVFGKRSLLGSFVVKLELVRSFLFIIRSEQLRIRELLSTMAQLAHSDNDLFQEFEIHRHYANSHLRSYFEVLDQHSSRDGLSGLLGILRLLLTAI